MKIPTKYDAIISLVGGQIRWTEGSDADEVEYLSGQTSPSDSAISTELTRLEVEWEAQAYARKREAEYPSIAELTVALYDTDDKATIETKRAAVKAKYPKPS